MSCCQSCGEVNGSAQLRCGSIACATTPSPAPYPARLRLPRADITPWSPGICLGAVVGVLARNSDLGVAKLRVRRRGTCAWALEYPAWDRADDGSVCFRFDAALCQLGNRLEAELLYNGLVFGQLEIRVRAQAFINTADISVLTRNAFPYPSSLVQPPGVSVVFEGFYPIYVPIQSVLEPAASELPICVGPNLNIMLALTPAVPVQLVLDDGINQEVVRYIGPTLGRVVVTRAQAGTAARRFPAGTVLRFAWTPANVAAALGAP